MGGVEGLVTAEKRLGAVGALERMSVDWGRLTRWLGGSEHNATRAQSYGQVKLLHTHETPRKRGLLSRRAVEFLRRFYAEDLRCIHYLCTHGWLPPTYYKGITNKSKLYAF